jgi:phage-related protein
MTEEGWKSVKPEKTKERDGIELYNQLKGELKIGDKLITEDGSIEIKDIKSKEISNPDMPLYNFNVSNDSSYVADKYIVHNKGGGNQRVICTELHRTKDLSTRDWIRDTKFTFKTLSKTHVKGYLLWAEPTVKHMQKYPKYRKMWKHIAQHRANDIAWRLNEGKFDLLGRIYAGIGEPLCWALGNFVSDKQISKYNLTHWRRA